MAKTIVALYDDLSTAERVVQDLIDAGFARESMSLVANDGSRGLAGDSEITYIDDDDVSAGEGAGFGAVVGTLVGLGVALIPGVGPILAAGPLAAALMAGIGAAAGAATGGIVAGLVDFGIPEDEAEAYIEGLRRGGTLLSMTVDEAHVNRVEGVMNAHDPVDIEHQTAGWRDAGWTAIDDETGEDMADAMAHEMDREADLMYRGPASGGVMAQTGDSPMDDPMDDGMARTTYRGVRTYTTRE